MPAARPPRITIIAGPNGAGKTTFAGEFLPQEAGSPVFVNADLIAAGLSPFNPARAALRAGRIMLQEIHQHGRARESFAFETTLAGRSYAPMIRRWRQSGYIVTIIFLSLSDVRVGIERVRSRVAQGGHDVPEPVIRRRFDAGLRNFHLVYRPLPLADEWSLYDNTGPSPVLLDAGDNS